MQLLRNRFDYYILVALGLLAVAWNTTHLLRNTPRNLLRNHSIFSQQIIVCNTGYTQRVVHRSAAVALLLQNNTGA